MTVVDLLHPAAAGDQGEEVGQDDEAKKTKFRTKRPAIDYSDSVDTVGAVTLFRDA